MEQKQTTVIIAYEIEQIAEVQSYMERENIPLDTCTIIPLEFEVEQALHKKSIPCESLLTYIPLEEEFSDVLDSATQVARRFHEQRAMQFYTHQGINLGEVFEPMIYSYLQYIGRYASIFKRIASAVEVKKLYIPYTTRIISPDMMALGSFEFTSPIDAVIAVARQYGFEVQTIGAPVISTPIREGVQFTRRATLFGLTIYNWLISFCVRPKPLKVYASEYWSHVESFIEKMDEVELVFMERSEIKNIPWRQLLRHRVRFLHSSDFISTDTQQNISHAVEAFSKQWHAMKGEVREVFNIVPGIDAWPEIERALTYLIETQTERALVDIEGLRSIMQKERPDKVLLRASVGGTAHHFFIAAKVAHQLGIPSIELQHAGAIVDPRSLHSRLAASYLAAYGPIVRELQQKNHGYAPERIRAIGSPRFDHYVHERAMLTQKRDNVLQKIGLDPKRPVVFAAVPFAGAFPLAFSSYQVADFFKAFCSAQQEMPELQFIFKFRPGDFSPFYQEYIREIFTLGGAVSTNTKDFLPLIMASDIACTGRSTLMYEIMLGGRPTILFPWQKWDTYTRAAYKGAVSIALDTKELSALLRQYLNKEEAEKVVKRQNTFLAENYSFDGHAPERMMALLREKLLPLP